MTKAWVSPFPGRHSLSMEISFMIANKKQATIHATVHNVKISTNENTQYMICHHMTRWWTPDEKAAYKVEQKLQNF